MNMAEAVDVHVLVGKEDCTTSSAIKGGEQHVRFERGISTSFQSKELKSENEQLAPPQQTVPVIEQQTLRLELEHIGTATLHGGCRPKGTKARSTKIVASCWLGSHNEALLCVFDGHGSRREGCRILHEAASGSCSRQSTGPPPNR